ncbi:MAG: DUF4384 domain-containing protein [Chlorobi bacterium]|nr:DUF4384 domain-containing protein [Chlorobiota bacterium]
MKRLCIISIGVIAILLVVAGNVLGFEKLQSPVASVPSSGYIEVWVDRGDEALYSVEDEINIFVRTASDCYLSVIYIDTEGRYFRLFPGNGNDGFVRGNEVYVFPNNSEGALRVFGPEGIGYIHVIAARTPLAFNPIFTRDGYCSLPPITGDPFLGINRFTGNYVDARFVVGTATATFFVGRRVWYPRYLCNSCHGSRPVPFDPYYSRCRKYVIRTSHSYDYWWRYRYIPSTIGVRFSGPFWTFSLRVAPWGPIPVHSYCRVAMGYSNMHFSRFPRRPYRPPVYPVFRNPRQRTYMTHYTRSSKPVRSGTAVRQSTITRTSTRVSRSSYSTIKSDRARHESPLQSKRNRYATLRNKSSRDYSTEHKSYSRVRREAPVPKNTRRSQDQKSRSRVSRSRDHANANHVTRSERTKRRHTYSATLQKLPRRNESVSRDRIHKSRSRSRRSR